jgi:hypothetical protein
MRRLIAGMVLASASAMTAAFAAPQDCPTAQSAAMGFVVERGEQSKTEVFHIGDTDIRTVLRFDGTTLLETTQFQGCSIWSASTVGGGPSSGRQPTCRKPTR